MKPIIKRNSTIPLEETYLLQQTNPKKGPITITILEGEEEEAK